MSTKIKKILPNRRGDYGKCFAVNEKPSRLAEVAKAIRIEAGYSLEKVVANSGGEISDGYISKIENGQDLSISLDKLFALAKGLKVSPQLLFDAAQGEMPKDGIHIDRAITIMRGLGEGDQRLAAGILEVLSSNRSDGGDRDGDPKPNQPRQPPMVKMPTKNLGRKKDGKKREVS